MAKYRDLPMDDADATLVALAEEIQTDNVFTLDRRGFSTYRMHGRKAFHLIPDR
jgi:predicted nucleic acid-binding protein